MFTFQCEKCGGMFYSKVDPSGWRHHLCNACSGKPYKDLPVEDSVKATTYVPKPVPTQPSYNKVPPTPVKKEFNLEETCQDYIMTYCLLKGYMDEAKETIPIENLCNWTTSIMIQKGK